MPRPLITGLLREEVECLRVLVVEDNEYMRRVLCEFLRALRVGKIRDASDGAEALEIMRGFRPDFIFADWRMERMDGLELVKRVRTGVDGVSPYVPIIMVTGHAEGPRVRAARDVGVTDLLVKPVSLATVAQRLGAVFQEPRPFIRVSGYFGPDRRRRAQPLVGADRRTGQQGLVPPAEMQGPELLDAV